MECFSPPKNGFSFQLNGNQTPRTTGSSSVYAVNSPSDNGNFHFIQHTRKPNFFLILDKLNFTAVHCFLPHHGTRETRCCTLCRSPSQLNMPLLPNSVFQFFVNSWKSVSVTPLIFHHLYFSATHLELFNCTNVHYSQCLINSKNRTKF